MLVLFGVCNQPSLCVTNTLSHTQPPILAFLGHIWVCWTVSVLTEVLLWLQWWPYYLYFCTDKYLDKTRIISQWCVGLLNYFTVVYSFCGASKYFNLLNTFNFFLSVIHWGLFIKVKTRNPIQLHFCSHSPG